MDTRSSVLHAIVLRSRESKENDRIVTLFSLEEGKLTAIAKGARKPTSHLRAAIQPFSLVTLSINPNKKAIPFISQGQADKLYLGVGADLFHLAYGSYLMELADAALPFGKPSRPAFVLILQTLSLLALDNDCARTLRWFELQLLQLMGVLPDLNKCAKCDHSLLGQRFVIDPRQGALLCASCSNDPEHTVSAGTVRTLHRLLSCDARQVSQIGLTRTTAEEAEMALAHCLDYYLEYSPRARQVLHSILQG